MVIIGAGQTAASAAGTLRRAEYDGEIVIVGDEDAAPYQRPPLSKEYLQGEAGLDALWCAPAEWYAEHDVELELNCRAISIDKRTKDVVLADGRILASSAVLIATGGSPRHLPGADEQCVAYLRTLADADRIRSFCRAGKKIVVVGGGFIGLEVAASASAMGADVTVLEAADAPLGRVLGSQLGSICRAIHEDNGVEVLCGETVESISRSSASAVVKTSGGRTIEGDLVVVGIGIAPNVEIAKVSELTVGNGIRVDEFCTTSADGIFAAGDVANHYHPLFDRRVRVEHFDNAIRQGEVAAKNMMGLRTVYDSPHWFWSDQYEHNLQFIGLADGADDLVVRGSTVERDFTAFYTADGRIIGAFAVNRGSEVMLAGELLRQSRALDPEMLRDDDVDLGELIEESPASSGGDGAAGRSEAGSSRAPEAHRGDFHRAARSGQVPDGVVRRFVVEGVEIAIARQNGVVYAVHNLCTHLACHLASGRVDDRGLTCLCHGSVFDLASGAPINPPATKPVRTYPIKEEDGAIYVAVD